MGKAADKAVKKLSESVKKDIQLKNQARRMAGLSPILIKMRICTACECVFESCGNRTCGCQGERNVGYIAGREIL